MEELAPSGGSKERFVSLVNGSCWLFFNNLDFMDNKSIFSLQHVFEKQ